MEFRHRNYCIMKYLICLYLQGFSAEIRCMPMVNRLLMLLVVLSAAGSLLGAASSPNRYIVQLAPTAQSAEIEKAAGAAKKTFGGAVGHRYRRAIQGFSITLPANVPMETLYKLPGVILVEPDIKLFLMVQTIPTGIRRINALRSPVADIDGIDKRVDIGVAVIDTGIDLNHPDLNVAGGRHFFSENVGASSHSFEDDNYQDTDGHGTHVAGIIGALDNTFGSVGVAPGARIWALKVFDDAEEGASTRDIIAALEWVIQNADQIQVVNISLGGTGTSHSFRTAVQNTVAAGVVVFASAGNAAEDVYGADGIFGTSDDTIPASFPEVAAVSALADRDGLPGGLGSTSTFGPDDSFANFSNFSASVVSDNPVVSPGAAIDLIMPGTFIYSTHLNGSYKTLHGTSMASPYAAGLAALYIAANGRANDAAGVYAIRQALINAGSAQTSPRGLKTLNDRDIFFENLGYIIPADFNDDGFVDVLDLATITAAWTATDLDPFFCSRCDIHLPPDGVIDLADIAEFAAYWLVGYD